MVRAKERYREFTEKQFNFHLYDMYKRKKINNYLNAQPDLVRNGYNVQEVVYVIRTHRKDVNILIYTSIDVRGELTSKGRNTVRSKGSDAVRVVLVRKNLNTGERYYKKIHKHLRINTLFTNLEKTLETTLKEIQSPSYKYEGFLKGIGLEYN